MAHFRITIAVACAVLASMALALPQTQVSKSEISSDAASAIVPEAEELVAVKNDALCTDAPDHETVLYLQIFLGYAGVAYGFMEQWWLFTISLLPFLGCLFFTIIAHWCKSEKGAIGCCAEWIFKWIAGIICVYCLGLYAWGIWAISQKDLLTGDGCPLK